MLAKGTLVHPRFFYDARQKAVYGYVSHAFVISVSIIYGQKYPSETDPYTKPTWNTRNSGVSVCVSRNS